MFSKYNISLSSKLSLGILLLAVPIFVISLGILFYQSRRIVRYEAMGRANSVLDATMQRVNNHILTVETATNANSWLVQQYFQPDSMLAISNRVVRLNPHIDGCSISTEPYVFPKYGRYFSVYTVRETDTISTVIEEEYEYFQKIWYKKPKYLDEPCWVAYYDEGDSLELTLDGMIASYSKPLYDTAENFVGIISTDISLLRLSKVITSERPYPNSYFVMLDKDGRYFIHPDSTQLFTHTIFSDADPKLNSDIIALGHEMTAGNSGHMAVDINGASCLVCYQPVPGTTWSLALICPDSDILYGYHRLSYILVPLLIVGLLVILLFSYRTVAHSIRPLNQLVAITQSIAAGDYAVSIPHSNRVDAVGRLQNSFATMSQSLRYHLDSIRETAGQAEHRNEELMRATQLAEEADRQKTAFIQNVTHQRRTPLNIIMGFTQILPDALASAATADTASSPATDASAVSVANVLPIDIAEMMHHNSSHLGRMVLMLFDSSDTGLSKELNSNKLDDISCNDVALEAISYVRPYYPDVNITFHSDVADDFTVKTNHVYLMRSLREVLYNSAKYSDGQHVSLSITVSGTMVRFTVQDTGPGIAEADRELMFKFFTKLDHLSEGLGLGLPLAKRHAQNLGGDLTIDPDYHDGCRMTIEIPVSKQYNDDISNSGR